MNEQQLQSILEQFMSQLKELLSQYVEEPAAEEDHSDDPLTKRVLLELASHEGLVLEAYKDSKGIWTWGIGVTSKSGHSVYPRYVDNPQTIARVIEIYKWLLETKYLPDVLEAFMGHELTENQLAGALSFHYNTGSIKKASWVKSFKNGDIEKAKMEFMNWRSPPEIIPRRKDERDLFFDGRWSNDGTVLVYTRVKKPSYTPDWGSAKRVDISKEF